MALVREHGGYGGFDGADAFDALGYGHDAMLGFDAASLFGGGGGSYAAAGAGCVAADSGNIVWPTGARAASSVLAFDRATAAAAVSGEEEDDDEECDAWIDSTDQSYGDAAAPEASHARTPTVSVGFDASTGCFTLTERAASSGGAGRAFGLLFPSTAAAPARASQKRTYVGVEPPAAVSPNKKHCGADRKATSRAKSAPTIPTKDPQSLAAKNRRERISERLRTLQELVPNGTKVDLVTMLEKAISYVKFLQLQVKVLATDEFWPAQGGKAPEISQVREALDAILSSASHRGQLN
ncbi:hypothetical protein SEVIR_1G298100v4 [Setaria viridis]|uniref:BHLH domain-containing protein n=1 Tax=Setaria viridis TaxID=4556 RepID=A0A4U6WEM2_SETVI|nr:transcription factor LATE FLOWERING-like [Setaria viridis]TKW41191.1 hypothetical protein SEVIR_1G298100v2 [Setaria viridis]